MATLVLVSHQRPENGPSACLQSVDIPHDESSCTLEARRRRIRSSAHHITSRSWRPSPNRSACPSSSVDPRRLFSPRSLSPPVSISSSLWLDSSRQTRLPGRKSFVLSPTAKVRSVCQYRVINSRQPFYRTFSSAPASCLLACPTSTPPRSPYQCLLMGLSSFTDELAHAAEKIPFTSAWIFSGPLVCPAIAPPQSPAMSSRPSVCRRPQTGSQKIWLGPRSFRKTLHGRRRPIPRIAG